MKPPRPIDGNRLQVGYDSAGISLQWERPEPDLDHGPATGFRILTSDDPEGPCRQQALVGGTEFIDASGSPPTDKTLFYRVVAMNPAGEAEENGLAPSGHPVSCDGAPYERDRP